MNNTTYTRTPEDRFLHYLIEQRAESALLGKTDIFDMWLEYIESLTRFSQRILDPIAGNFASTDVAAAIARFREIDPVILGLMGFMDFLNVKDIEEALDDPLRLFTFNPEDEWVPLSHAFPDSQHYYMAVGCLRDNTTRVVFMDGGVVTFHREVGEDGDLSIASPEWGGAIPVFLAKELPDEARSKIEEKALSRWGEAPVEGERVV